MPRGFLLTKRVIEQAMEYYIFDFSAWEEDGKFGNTFNALIDGLGLFYKRSAMSNQDFEDD
jgi:cellulose synthase/poly-beta-1,6-N-acetylglucosamine synthase-like glycosyltransferase